MAGWFHKRSAAASRKERLLRSQWMAETGGMGRPDIESRSDALRCFIAERIGVSSDDILDDREWGSSGNTIGTICLRVGLLNFEQVETIVDTQSVTGALFGETGIRLGFLKREELESVLRVQQVHRHLDLGAQLLIRGTLELPQFLALVAEFIGKGTRAVAESED